MCPGFVQKMGKYDEEVEKGVQAIFEKYQVGAGPGDYS